MLARWIRRPAGALAAIVICCAAPASAEALAVHVVARGESLWSVAGADGISETALAAANGLPRDAQVLAGQHLVIPGPAASAESQERPAATAPEAVPTSVPSSVRGAPGVHLVLPGESLWSVAAANRVSEPALAAANGLPRDAHVLAGQRLVIPGATAAPTVATVPVADRGVPVSSTGVAVRPTAVPGLPVPVPGRVTAAQVGSAAAAQGVPASLGKAVAWQESGFNNAMVSGANARGVMQIIPSTWQFIQSQLTREHLDAYSPAGNVHAGMLLLGYLLRQTGSESAAVASYYQGLHSVWRTGPLPETQRYVNSVMALRRSFAGG